MPLPSNSNILLITLKTFSATGGIEKVSRILAKALHDICTAGQGSLQVMSMHDHTSQAEGNQYIPAGSFTGFGGNKTSCVWNAVRAGRKKDLVILTHVNLLLVGWLIKKTSPSTKIVLLLHGIEIWKLLSSLKKKMLGAVDIFLTVSDYTRREAIRAQGISAEKCHILNNCLDPYLLTPVPRGSNSIREKYAIDPAAVVLFCLTRVAATERHKGYDKVIRSIKVLQEKLGKKVVFVIAGKYTIDESVYINQIAKAAAVPDNVVLTGFVPEQEIPAHFAMADLYVMPSTKEGFGLVFIEAIYYGLPVIAGNKDGSADALLNGELGLLVNPGDEAAILQAILTVLNHTGRYTPAAATLQAAFGFEQYRAKLKELLFAEA